MAGRRTVLATFFTTFITLQLARVANKSAHAHCDTEMAERCEEERVSCTFDSPVGRLKLSATSEGVCAVTWLTESEETQLEQEMADSSDAAKAKQHLKQCSEWLTAYFSGSLMESPVPAPPLAIPMKSTQRHLYLQYHKCVSILCRLIFPHCLVCSVQDSDW